jgi:hypothetical protein
MVVGGLPTGSRDLCGGRRIGSGMRSASTPRTLMPGEFGSPLEALHSMDCADRAVLVTLGQALDLAEEFPPEQVGVVVDTFRVRWDADVWRSIERAGSRIASFPVCDWILPLRADVLLARGYMSDRSIDFPPFVTAVDAAGYRGNIEGEMFDADVWASPGASPRSCGASSTWSFPATLHHEHPPVAPKPSAFHLGHRGYTS